MSSQATKLPGCGLATPAGAAGGGGRDHGPGDHPVVRGGRPRDRYRSRLHAQVKLSYAIDAAGLAGGQAFDTDHRREDILMFFEANFPTGYMSSELLPDHPIITSTTPERITIEASATIPTYFMRVVGFAR